MASNTVTASGPHQVQSYIHNTPSVVYVNPHLSVSKNVFLQSQIPQNNVWQWVISC